MAYLGAISGQVISLLSLVGIKEEVTIHECIWIVALVIIVPLSLLPEEGSSMRFAGFLGAICMVYIAFTVILGDGLRALQKGGLCSLSPAASEPELPALTPGWVIFVGHEFEGRLRAGPFPAPDMLGAPAVLDDRAVADLIDDDVDSPQGILRTGLDGHRRDRCLVSGRLLGRICGVLRNRSR